MPKTCLIPPPQPASEAFLGAERNGKVGIVTGKLLIDQDTGGIQFKIGIAKCETRQGIGHIAMLLGGYDEFEQHGKLKKGIVHLYGIPAQVPADMVAGNPDLNPIFL